MDIFEIPERKLVSRFGPFSMALIDPEMPFAIFSESVRANELVLLLHRRMMISHAFLLSATRCPCAINSLA